MVTPSTSSESSTGKEDLWSVVPKTIAWPEWVYRGSRSYRFQCTVDSQFGSDEVGSTSES